MTEARSNLWRSSGSTPLLKQGHLKLIASTTSRQLLKISKKGDSTTSTGNLCQCSATLTVKKVFPEVWGEPPLFHLVPIACHWAWLKRAWLPLLYTLFSDIGTHWWDSTLTLLWETTSSLSLFSYEGCSRPLIVFVVLHCILSSTPCLSCTVDPSTQYSTPGMTLPVLNRGERSLSQPAGNTPPNVALDTILLFCHKGTLLVHVQFGVYQAPRSSSVKLLSSQLASSIYWYMVLFLTKSTTLHFALLNCMTSRSC